MSNLFSFLKEFDMAAMLPEITSFEGQLAWWMRIILLIGPLVVAGLGAIYYFIPPDEANYHLGYRSKWSMQSVPCWRYAQKVAGMVYMILGGGMFVLMLILACLLGLMKPMGMAITTVICGLVQIALVICAHIFIEKKLQNTEKPE